ncbi:hypothetical protein [Phenylobacterium sp.]|uniref:hypothetical protein n=1 Tax=Phenylobacterium sp. TaxID=1871053 RepID=UPI002737E189|nr:hypothetical protein [Phenylobacterium sp.]MDP3869919.1 hypothetical protein [Phenylobacterium sp.]
MSTLTIAPAEVIVEPVIVAPVVADPLAAAVALADAQNAARLAGKDPSLVTSADPVVDPNAPVKPEWVEDKFWDATTGTVNAEALAASYKALQAAQSKAKPADPVVEPEAAAADGAEPEVQNALAAAGFEYAALATEFETNGDFTPDTVAKLEATFGKDLVTDYREAKKSQFASATVSYDATVTGSLEGGAETYGKVSAWAKDALSEADLTAFNADVQSMDVRRATLAVQNLAARYSAEGGNPPALLGGSTTTTAVGGFASIEQMSDAVSSLQYRNDSAFRAETDRKIAASTSLMR